GLATAGTAGQSTTISATLSGISGSTTLTASAATLISIAVTPANSSAAAGTTVQFHATGTYSNNSTQDLTSTVTWASSNTAGATITAAGLATAGTAGQSTTISATLGGVSGSTTFTATAATLKSIAVTPVNSSAVTGTAVQFHATGTYSNNSTQDLTSTATWASSNTAGATITAAGLATAGTAGQSTTISATLGGISGSTTFTATAVSSGINFGSGFSSIGLVLNGTAVLNGTRLRLTDGGASEAGSGWFSTPVNVQTFTTDFMFQLTAPNADGMTFTIQNTGTTAIGLSGGGLGFGPDTTTGPAGIGKSVAVKFDLYNNAGEGANSTGIYTNGVSPTMPATALGGGVNLHSGDIFKVHMTYDGTTLTMTITDTVNTAQTFTTSWPINIPATVGANTAYLGFTGGTGGATATQEILTWTFTNTFTPVKTPVVYQSSNLPAVSSGPTFRQFTYSSFPDLTGTILDATKVGDNVTFTVNVATPGTYDIAVSYKAFNTRGIWQLAINGTNVGVPADEYAALDSYAVVDLGNFTFPAAGNYSFKFTVTGRNANSSGYSISFDDFTLTPQ
ncbi:MAG TPA: Ig-like domain-containing protein, partial [Candidatus Acidoferrum sp.]|nr:Ig-like domain-containing protein [Candidatus Acidoferrum sp.]